MHNKKQKVYTTASLCTPTQVYNSHLEIVVHTTTAQQYPHHSIVPQCNGVEEGEDPLLIADIRIGWVIQQQLCYLDSVPDKGA